MGWAKQGAGFSQGGDTEKRGAEEVAFEQRPEQIERTGARRCLGKSIAGSRHGSRGPKAVVAGLV